MFTSIGFADAGATAPAPPLHPCHSSAGLPAGGSPPEETATVLVGASVRALLWGGRGSCRAVAHKVFAARQEPRPPTLRPSQKLTAELTRLRVLAERSRCQGWQRNVFAGMRSGRGCGGGEPLRLRIRLKES